MAGTHTVKQGEHLSGIAESYGFPNWRTIYNHPNNQVFRKKRSNPDVILTVDRIFIPDLQPKEHYCATDQRHRFLVKRPLVLFKLTLKDAGGNPIGNEQYTLTVGSKTYKGQTDGEGFLQQKIPAKEQKGHLILSRIGLCWDLNIGHLDPVQDDHDAKEILSGVQARLNNLGFACGKADGLMGPKTRAALRMFQIDAMGRDPHKADGKCDRETRDALNKEHGC